MRTGFRAFAVIASATLAFPTSAAVVLWDNYSNNSFDYTRYVSAERRTLVGPTLQTASWAVDDASFDNEVVLDTIEWVGLRQLGSTVPGFGYDTADFAFFTREVDPFSGAVTFTVVPGAFGQEVSWEKLQELGSWSGYNAYEGRITLAEPITLPAGDYWVGVRLVGNVANQNTGRAFQASRAGGVNSEGSSDGGYVYNPAAFGDFNWRAGSQLPGFAAPIDWAFRLAYSIPEPSSLVLLAAGALAAFRRR